MYSFEIKLQSGKNRLFNNDHQTESAKYFTQSEIDTITKINDNILVEGTEFDNTFLICNRIFSLDTNKQIITEYYTNEITEHTPGSCKKICGQIYQNKIYNIFISLYVNPIRFCVGSSGDLAFINYQNGIGAIFDIKNNKFLYVGSNHNTSFIRNIVKVEDRIVLYSFEKEDTYWNNYVILFNRKDTN